MEEVEHGRQPNTNLNRFSSDEDTNSCFRLYLRLWMEVFFCDYLIVYLLTIDSLLALCFFDITDTCNIVMDLKHAPSVGAGLLL